MKDLPPISKLIEVLGYTATAVYIQLYDLYRKQRKQQGHYHDGRYWVRMPYDDFPRMFPSLSDDTVHETLGKLEDEGLLRMVHYGDLSWYVAIQFKSACRQKKRATLKTYAM